MKIPKEIPTWGGLILAIVSALQDIDVHTFDIRTDWGKLVIPLFIAIGGYISRWELPVFRYRNPNRNE